MRADTDHRIGPSSMERNLAATEDLSWLTRIKQIDEGEDRSVGPQIQNHLAEGRAEAGISIERLYAIHRGGFSGLSKNARMSGHDVSPGAKHPSLR